MDESATEVLTGIYDGSADSRTLALVRLAGEGGEASVVWQSEEFPTGVYGGALAISGETAFAAVYTEGRDDASSG